MHRCFTLKHLDTGAHCNWMLCGNLIHRLFDGRLLCLKTCPPVTCTGDLYDVFFMKIVALMRCTVYFYKKGEKVEI